MYKKKRQLTIDNFIAYYLIDTTAKNVTVVRIVYGGRDIKDIITSNE